MRRRILPVAALALAALAGCGSTVTLGSGQDATAGLADGLNGDLNSLGTPTSTPAAGADGGSVLQAGPTATTGTDGGSVDIASTAPTTPGIALPTTTTKPITIGITYTKPAGAGLAAIGASGTLGDQLAYAKIVVADANAHGGLHGRKIQPIYYGYDANPGAPSYPVQDQSACQYFTQDNHVELAIVNLAGPDLSVCLQKKNVPMVVEGSGGWTANDFRKIPLLFNFDGINLDRRAQVWVQQLKAESYFAKWNTSTGSANAAVAPVKIGVVTYDDPAFLSSAKTTLVNELTAAGFAKPQVVTVAAPNSYGNIAAMQTQLTSAVLTFKTAGVTHVLINDSNGVGTLFFMTYAANQNYRPRYGVTTGNNMSTVSGLVTANQLEGAVGIGWTPLLDLGDNEGGRYTTPGRTACNALMKAHNQGGEDYNEGFALVACSSMQFVKTRYDSLTSLSAAAFAKAMELTGGSFTPLMTPASYLGPGRHDGLAGVRQYFYDLSCKCMAYKGGVIALPH